MRVDAISSLFYICIVLSDDVSIEDEVALNLHLQ